jgi:hypothetical protein
MSTHAEDTAAILQQAAHGGLPVLIPGALEVRAGRPPARPGGAAEPAAPHAAAAAVFDRDRLEHEREGGGAPSQRRHPLPAQQR